MGVVSAVGVGTGAAVGVFDRSADPATLQSRTAVQLVSDIRAAHARGMSGTVVLQLALAPAAMPALKAAADLGSARPLGGLLSGSHTVRYWYGGPDRQRVVLFSATEETDIFRVGTDLWRWDSARQTAVHSVGNGGRSPLSLANLMPQELCARALAAVDKHTALTVGKGARIADRDTYQLVLTPHDVPTRVASVRIDVDAVRHVPLGVQVFARGVAQPVVDVSFTSVSFKAPSAELFAFTPPPGSTVAQRSGVAPLALVEAAGGTGADGAVSVVGSGWTAIAEYRGGRAEVARLTAPLSALMRAVRGPWGKGHLLESALLCALVTDDGRILVGAVEPAALYAAAAVR